MTIPRRRLAYESIVRSNCEIAFCFLRSLVMLTNHNNSTLVIIATPLHFAQLSTTEISLHMLELGNSMRSQTAIVVGFRTTA